MLYESLTHDGLLLSNDLRDYVSDPRALARDVDRGLLIRLRRGAYVSGPVWAAATPRARHILRIRAVLALSSRPLILAGASAAAVWDMPIAGDWPTDVVVADSWRGGGRSEPGVRVTAAGYPTTHVVERDGFLVTDISRTALCVARRLPLIDVVGSLDWAQWRKNDDRVARDALFGDLDAWHPRVGFWGLQQALLFSTHLSDSFGESRARVAIRQCGFEDPDLQVEFRDSEGRMPVDFCWPRIHTVAEFDGKVKYTREQFTGGDPGEVVWKEKRRQDRLRRLGLDVERITTYEVEHPEVLKRLLDDLGVPRRG